MFEVALYSLLWVNLVMAVVFDLRSRRIPNTLIVSAIMVAAGIHVLGYAVGRIAVAGPNWWSPFWGLCVGFALLLPIYVLRATGAGDVKLMAMVGAFIGAPAVVDATLYTLLAGGLLSLVFMLGRGVAAQTLHNVRFMLTDTLFRAQTGQGARLPPLQTTAARLPYAVAIACGTAAALLWPLFGR